MQPASKRELDRFVSTHEETAEDLQLSLDKSLLKAKKQETRSRPSQIVSKSISLLKDVDTNIFDKLTEPEKENLRSQLSRLSTVVEHFDNMVSDEGASSGSGERIVTVVTKKSAEVNNLKPRYYIAKRRVDEPMVNCLSQGKSIANLSVTLEFELCGVSSGMKEEVMYKAFFIDDNNEIISDIVELQLKDGDREKVTITLHSKASSYSGCSLALQSSNDESDELQQLIPFSINMSFTADFDF